MWNLRPPSRVEIRRPRMKKNLSRRQFLAHSAGLAGASLGLGVGRQGSGETLLPEVRLGFIGAGDRGKHLLGAALRGASGAGVPAARITAVCDVSPRALKRGLEIAGGSSPPGAP